MSKKRTRQIIVGNTPLNVDFGELQKQRRRLWGMVQETAEGAFVPRDPKVRKDTEALEGIMNLLDAFVDASALVLGDNVVFGKVKK
jgi:hypothetical protein